MSFDRNCSKCDAATSDKLVEIFPAWNSPIRGQAPYSMWVCSSCLVGAMVPVIRPSTETWEFGTVERACWGGHHHEPPNYSDTRAQKNSQHFLRFMDSQCEWVNVEATAYDQYIAHFKHSLVLLSSASYYGGDVVGSFGNNDDDETDIDSNDEFQRPSTPRRLETFFGADVKIDSPMVQQQSLVKLASSPHSRVPTGRSPRSGTSMASSLSVTTLDDSMIVEDDGSPGSSPYTTPTKMSSSRRRGHEFSPGSPKYSQKLWTPEEDEVLLRAIAAQSKTTLKWSTVSKVVPGRSGKQCRERYLNHLTPSIKLKNWSPVEDATIFRLYHTDGSKWSMMSKLLRGRTDNGIKNRYHHLKRRLERQMQMIPTSVEIESIIDRLNKSPFLEFSDEWLLKYVATQSMLPRKKLDKSEAAEYLRPACNELCARCGLVVPSRQTGASVCKTTGWCEVCIRVSPCLSGDLLRTLDDLRKVAISG